MAPACDRFYSAVVTETLRHDGDPRLARHVANAHARDTRYGRVIVKDTKDSPHKIDLAVAAVIAHERATFRADHPVAEPEIMVALG
jgi:phage terminase large subunit-like protein